VGQILFFSKAIAPGYLLCKVPEQECDFLHVEGALAPEQLDISYITHTHTLSLTHTHSHYNNYFFKKYLVLIDGVLAPEQFDIGTQCHLP
jgi:hypothetical protein